MFQWEPPLNPPEKFQEILWRMQMTEEEYYEYLKEIEEKKIDAFMHL